MFIKNSLSPRLMLLFLALTQMPNAFAVEPYLGEIRWFAGNFAPRGWALCDGQILPINQNQSLYSLLGTTYGGDGRTSFALPDMRGRIPTHEGQGAGLSSRALGEKSGSETFTITEQQMPTHTHALNADTANGTDSSAVNSLKAGVRRGYTAEANTIMHSDVISNTGGGQAVNNIPPVQGINCIIALQGIFPPRN
jgi:microcystin-dependent protein